MTHGRLRCGDLHLWITLPKSYARMVRPHMQYRRTQEAQWLPSSVLGRSETSSLPGAALCSPDSRLYPTGRSPCFVVHLLHETWMQPQGAGTCRLIRHCNARREHVSVWVPNSIRLRAPRESSPNIAITPRSRCLKNCWTGRRPRSRSTAPSRTAGTGWALRSRTRRRGRRRTRATHGSSTSW